MLETICKLFEMTKNDKFDFIPVAQVLPHLSGGSSAMLRVVLQRAAGAMQMAAMLPKPRVACERSDYALALHI
ncbi:hypothetical protein DSM101010T_03140 [Desulfovibrio subterraneus]|jgi:hypothetical protein|uniref:Uncharacterized protein n=1 Tax=Desulfovibrio subterraneus TaxID=2718620 RepID=A0A7J0BE23_9BACT|nr:hypothetical protein DSM101010T_03140 [Desulfovibrio subterraneus]